MFAIFYSTKDSDTEIILDHWEMHDTFIEAEAAFEELLKRDDLWSATIAQPIRSTEPHFLMDS